MYFLMTSKDKYVFFGFVNLLSSSSVSVLWVCVGKRTQRRCFQSPSPFLFSHQTWHILLDCIRGASLSWRRMQWGMHRPSGTGCSHMLFRWHGVAFSQIARFEVSSLINTSNLHEAVLFSQHVWSPVVLYYHYFFLLHPLHKLHSCKLLLQLLSSSW